MYIKFLGFNTAFSTVTLEIFKALKYLCYVLVHKISLHVCFPWPLLSGSSQLHGRNIPLYKFLHQGK